MNGKWISREDFGAHEHRRNRKTEQILSEGREIQIPEAKFHLADLAEWNSVRDAVQANHMGVGRL